MTLATPAATLAGVDEAARRNQGIRRVLVGTLLLNTLVAVLKLSYGKATHTLALEADGYHSLTDGANNVLGLVSLWWSSRPPDSEHPYGHEKVEVLAASVIGASLILVAWNLVSDAVERLRGGAAPPTQSYATWAVALLTLAVNIGVARYEARRARELGSAFLESDAAHTLSDVLVTIGVLVTVTFVQLGYVWVDSIAAVAIAVFILITGVRVVGKNLGYLMDSAQVDARRVHSIVCKVAGVAGAHKIRTRGTPGAIRIDLHIQIAPHLDVRHAHRVTHWAIDALKRELDGVRDVVVHTEPAADDAPYPELPSEMRPRSPRSDDARHV